MRLNACLSTVFVLGCVLQWQPCSAYDDTTAAAASQQRRRLQGSQPSIAAAAHARAAVSAEQERKLSVSATRRRNNRSKPSAPTRKMHKRHGRHAYPHASAKPSPSPMPPHTEHPEQQHRRPSRPPHSHPPHSHAKTHTHVPPPAEREAAFDEASLLNSTVITKRACGVVADSDEVKQEVQSRLLPTIGALAQQGRVATVNINVYFSINRVGGALLILKCIARSCHGDVRYLHTELFTLSRAETTQHTQAWRHLQTRRPSS